MGEEFRETVRKLRDFAFRNENYDCSEIADDLRDFVGEGEVVKIEPTSTASLVVKEEVEGFVKEVKYDNHYVFQLGDFVYDLRLSENPLDGEKYFDDVKNMNDGGVRFKRE